MNEKTTTSLLEVKLLDYADLSEDKKKDYKYQKYATFLQVIFKGEEIAFHSDEMEPEDVRFYRNLSWVPDLLEKVYQLGLEGK